MAQGPCSQQASHDEQLRSTPCIPMTNDQQASPGPAGHDQLNAEAYLPAPPSPILLQQSSGPHSDPAMGDPPHSQAATGWPETPGALPEHHTTNNQGGPNGTLACNPPNPSINPGSPTRRPSQTMPAPPHHTFNILPPSSIIHPSAAPTTASPPLVHFIPTLAPIPSDTAPTNNPPGHPTAAVVSTRTSNLFSPPHSPTFLQTTTILELPATSPSIVRVGDLTVEQPSIDADEPPPRVRTYSNYALTTAVCLLVVLLVSVGGIVRTTLYAVSTHQYMYLVGAALQPINVLFLLFPAFVVVGGVLIHVFGPVWSVKMNSQMYSVLRTPPPKGAPLPPVVVMMPVYKEDLDEVIRPTHDSVQAAMEHYTAMGGSTWWIICDDGYMVLDKGKSMKRLAFYAENDITFVARPPHSKEQPRRGLFKKASNMNYTLRLSDLIKERMAAEEGIGPLQALAQIWEERGKEFRAAGNGIHIPEDALVLLIDADTRVPPTCIYDTVGEFMCCPELAYTQHFTTPFADQNRNYFEAMLSFFTRKIYFNGFVVPCSLGACAPLVGHNAFLRYSSINAAAFKCPVEGTTKYWSEETVSEDFDLFMRLAQKNMWGRLVAYTGDEFREGVSLTYMDEVGKFRKFAYGSCEMMFNRFKDWPRRGIITPMFWGFLTSRNIPWPQKQHLVAYLFTYLAMASAFYTTYLEAVASIVLPGLFDHFGSRAFDITLTCFFVFAVIATICSILFRTRVRHISAQAIGHAHSFFDVMLEEVMYIPILTLFFASILFHLTTACFCYFFNLKLDWGATVKERLEGTSAWRALRNTVEAYWKMYLLMSVSLGLYFAASTYFGVGMYRGWSLHCYALAHMLGPILLNPDIVRAGWGLSKKSKRAGP